MVNVTVWGMGRPCHFVKAFKLTRNRRKSGIVTVRRVQVKIANYLVIGKTRMEIDSHADTVVLGKECMKYTIGIAQ